jgi:hypothetical protein
MDRLCAVNAASVTCSKYDRPSVPTVINITDTLMKKYSSEIVK